MPEELKVLAEGHPLHLLETTGQLLRRVQCCPGGHIGRSVQRERERSEAVAECSASSRPREFTRVAGQALHELTRKLHGWFRGEHLAVKQAEEGFSRKLPHVERK